MSCLMFLVPASKKTICFTNMLSLAADTLYRSKKELSVVLLAVVIGVIWAAVGFGKKDGDG